MPLGSENDGHPFTIHSFYFYSSNRFRALDTNTFSYRLIAYFVLSFISCNLFVFNRKTFGHTTSVCARERERVLFSLELLCASSQNFYSISFSQFQYLSNCVTYRLVFVYMCDYDLIKLWTTFFSAALAIILIIIVEATVAMQIIILDYEFMYEQNRTALHSAHIGHGMAANLFCIYPHPAVNINSMHKAIGREDFSEKFSTKLKHIHTHTFRNNNNSNSDTIFWIATSKRQIRWNFKWAFWRLLMLLLQAQLIYLLRKTAQNDTLYYAENMQYNTIQYD